MKIRYVSLFTLIGALAFVAPPPLCACTDIAVEVTGYLSTAQQYTPDHEDMSLAKGHKDSHLVPLTLEQVGLGETDVSLLFRRVEDNMWRVDLLNDLVVVPLERRQIVGPAATINFDDNGKQISGAYIFALPTNNQGRENGSTVTIFIHSLELTSGAASIHASLSTKKNVPCSEHGRTLTIKNTAEPGVHDELNPITVNAERAFVRNR